MEDRFQPFLSGATVALGGLTGLLIALPLAVQQSGGAALAVVGLALGLAVGYRRRRSRPFFYLCLVSVLILASLVTSQLIAPFPPG